MKDFENGDFVRLFLSEGYNCKRHNSCKIFSIEGIGTETLILKDVGVVNKHHVQPIHINFQDDCDIYLIYPPHATYDIDNSTGEVSHAYYLNTLKRKYPWIYSKVCNFEYVHEVQHFFRNNKDLRMSLAIDA